MDKLERLLATGRINAISPTLADRLGRTDLGGYSPPSGPLDPYSNPMVAAGQVQAAISRLDSGRISAGLVGLLVIAGAGFYLWTRKFQS
jgi:hypothetical protein